MQLTTILTSKELMKILLEGKTLEIAHNLEIIENEYYTPCGRSYTFNEYEEIKNQLRRGAIIETFNDKKIKLQIFKLCILILIIFRYP